MFGEVRGFHFFPNSENDNSYPPFQNDFIYVFSFLTKRRVINNHIFSISAHGMLALQGYKKAADILSWMKNFAVNAALEASILIFLIPSYLYFNHYRLVY